MHLFLAFVFVNAAKSAYTLFMSIAVVKQHYIFTLNHNPNCHVGLIVAMFTSVIVAL